ncbi:MAG: hypothetical protein ACI8UO_000893 [Verrucomicrobiales bacterium]
MKTARYVQQLLAEVKLDHAALGRKIRGCDLGTCHGTCCHDGAYLNSDEAALIPKLVDEHRDFFEALGLDLPAKTVVRNRWRGYSGLKTATRAEPMAERVFDYPNHFAQTQCVFLTSDAKCGLQALAADLGEQPWFYKPFTCWMHPLSIHEGVLTLFDRESDPQNFPDYPGFVSLTHCGRADACGEPAFEVLSAELTALGQIGERDFLGELREALS